MFGSLFISRAWPELTQKKWYQYFSAFGTLIIGLWGTFILLALTFDVIKILVTGSYMLFQSKGLYFGKLTSIFDHINQTLLPLAGAAAFFGFFEVLRGPVVKTISVQRKNINDDLNQFKIAQISDLHIGSTIRTPYVNRVIERTNALSPDIIVITGDLIDAEVQSVDHITQLLSKLKAKYGVYFVPGNHEYYWNIESIIESLKKTGMQILLNENKIIKINNTDLMIAGITDPAAHSIYPSHKPDLNKTALSQTNANFKILLAHQPGVYAAAEKLKFDLQLSGHTHAGQFFPFNIIVSFVHKYSRGLYLHDSMHVYVNSGTGYWGPANRFGIPAEITLLELNKNG